MLKKCVSVDLSPKLLLKHRALLQEVGRGGAGLAASTLFYWKNKTDLKVYFHENIPYPNLKNDILSLASTWSDHGSITFTETTDKTLSDISISFDNNLGMWSYIGVKSKAIIAENKPSMNLDPSWGLVDGFMNDDTRFGLYLKGVIMHEFGHALGFIHEHQRKDRPFTWNKVWMRANMDKLGLPNWASIRQNYLSAVAVNYLNKSPFDYKSIMIYSWNRNATIEKIANRQTFSLSETDKARMGEIYPK